MKRRARARSEPFKSVRHNKRRAAKEEWLAEIASNPLMRLTNHQLTIFGRLEADHRRRTGKAPRAKDSAFYLERARTA